MQNYHVSVMNRIQASACPVRRCVLYDHVVETCLAFHPLCMQAPTVEVSDVRMVVLILDGQFDVYIVPRSKLCYYIGTTYIDHFSVLRCLFRVLFPYLKTSARQKKQMSICFFAVKSVRDQSGLP